MKRANVLKHDLWVPDNVADWDAVAGNSRWERDRIASIIATMTSCTGLLYDVGVEHGWMSAIFAQHINGERMVLCEPSPEFWPNIRKTWEMNDLDGPHSCWEGFVNEETDWKGTTPEFGDWPSSSLGEECGAMAYRSIPNQGEHIPSITIDALAALVGSPKGITIDVEGAELRVLRGAKAVLMHKLPYVWVSIHPDLMLRDYDDNADEIQTYMSDLGYEGRLLAIDHEEHHFFWPEGKWEEVKALNGFTR